MRNKIITIAFFVVFCFCTSGFSGDPKKEDGIIITQPEDLYCRKFPEDHPIYTFDHATKRLAKITGSPPLTFRGISRQAPLYGRANQILLWNLQPLKEEILIGEPLFVKISIENHHKYVDLAKKFSPPYQGAHVDTVGVWKSRWLPEKEVWSELEPITEFNAGYSHSVYLQRQGKPIILSPGDEWQSTFPVNINQHPFSYRFMERPAGLESKWYPTWPAEPGRYRLYLRYANLERWRRFEVRYPSGESSVKTPRKTGEPRLVSSGIKVIGPIEVMVVEPEDADLAAGLRELIESWNRSSIKYHFRNRRRENFEWEPELYDAIRNHPELGKTPLARSLQLTDLRRRLEKILAENLELPRLRQRINWLESREADSDKIAALVLELLPELEELSERAEPGAFRDAVDLTRCWVLSVGGEKNEAAELARTIENPDAEVFLDDLEVDEARMERWRDFRRTPSFDISVSPALGRVLEHLRSDDPQEVYIGLRSGLGWIASGSIEAPWEPEFPEFWEDVFKEVSRILETEPEEMENPVKLRLAIEVVDPELELGHYYRTDKDVKRVQEAIERWNATQSKDDDKWIFFELEFDEDANPVKYRKEEGN